MLRISKNRFDHRMAPPMKCFRNIAPLSVFSGEILYSPRPEQTLATVSSLRYIAVNLEIPHRRQYEFPS